MDAMGVRKKNKDQSRTKVREGKAVLAFRAAGLVAVFSLALAVLPRAASGKTVANVEGMLPKETRVLAYCDLKSARELSSFPRIQKYILPDHFLSMENIVSKAGIDPNAQIEGVLWGLILDDKGTERLAGFAFGQFNPESSEALLQKQDFVAVNYRGISLWTPNQSSGSNDIWFSFLDANTIAFGERPSLETLIQVHDGELESLVTNSALFPMVNEENGKDAWLWAVLDAKYASKIIDQLFPIAREFPQTDEIRKRLRAIEIRFRADGDTESSHFLAICGSADDANLMAVLLQADMQYRRYQEEQNKNSDFVDALQTSTVSLDGERLAFDITINPDQLLFLLKM